MGPGVPYVGRVPPATSDPVARLLGTPPDLPVVAGLAAVAEALRSRGVAVVQAPPGTGKTSLVPPAVAALVGPSGRVVVTQPRRIAARAAARRIAHLLGEPVGSTVGYAVRGDRRTSDATRIEVVTTGVLLRRLQRDPALPGVAAVVLDEVHERQLDADLTLALLVDVRENLREDLPLVAMSATVEATRTSALLGDAPVVTVPGALHPVTETWCPLPTGVRRSDDRGVTPRFLDHVAAHDATGAGRAARRRPGVRAGGRRGDRGGAAAGRRRRRRAPAARAADGRGAGPGPDRRAHGDGSWCRRRSRSRRSPSPASARSSTRGCPASRAPTTGAGWPAW